MDRLPAIKITQGEPFASAFMVIGQDWTGYTGTVAYRKAPQGDDILDTAATGEADGDVLFALTAEQTADFPALPVIGHRKVGVYQVTMSNGADVRTFQGDLMVAGAV